MAQRRSPRLLVLVSAIAFSTFFGQRSSPALMKAVQASGHLVLLPTLPPFQGRRDGRSNATYFSRHASGWEQRSDRGCAPAFPTDNR